MTVRLIAGATALALLVSARVHAVDRETPTQPTASPSHVVRGGTLEIPRHVIGTGGGRSAGGAWVIKGTAGQSDADPLQPSTDGVGFYAIAGGFWPALPAPQTDGLFIDGFEAQAK